MIVTNASGGVNESFSVGDIMCIEDHIKLVADNPLRGENLSEFGTRFPNMVGAYSPELINLAKKASVQSGVYIQSGVYMYFTGPQYETPAEIRAARVLGADAVGMSTVPEVIAAAHAGCSVLGFSLVSNMAAGITGQALTEEEVFQSADAARERFSALILKCLELM